MVENLEGDDMDGADQWEERKLYQGIRDWLTFVGGFRSSDDVA